MTSLAAIAKKPGGGTPSVRGEPTPDQLRAFRRAWEAAPKRTTPTPEQRAQRCTTAMALTVALDSRDLIKFGSAGAAGRALHVCERPRTACAIVAAGLQPVWSLGSSEALAGLPPQPGIEELWIHCGSDPVSRAAAMTCARRWRDAGSSVSIHRRNQITSEADTPLVRTEGLFP